MGSWLKGALFAGGSPGDEARLSKLALVPSPTPSSQASLSPSLLPSSVCKLSAHEIRKEKEDR